MRRALVFAAGLLATVATSAAWHGPLGAGEGLSRRAEALARATLDHYEMPVVSARLERDPLSRQMILSGPADPFQRAELVRILSEIPGVTEVRWDPASLPQEGGRS